MVRPVKIKADDSVVQQPSESYLEEKCPVAVDSSGDHADGNDVGLKLKLELAEVQYPWEFVQLLHLHCSSHGFTHHPDTQTHDH